MERDDGMTHTNGKGDKRRPLAVDQSVFENRWEQTFKQQVEVDVPSEEDRNDREEHQVHDISRQ